MFFPWDRGWGGDPYAFFGGGGVTRVPVYIFSLTPYEPQEPPIYTDLQQKCHNLRGLDTETQYKHTKSCIPGA